VNDDRTPEPILADAISKVYERHRAKRTTRLRMFKKGSGPWTQYRGEGVDEVDFHWADDNQSGPKSPYEQRMAEVASFTVGALKSAHERCIKYVLFRHGWSTSRGGKSTSRSAVRKVMRSREATPYIAGANVSSTTLSLSPPFA
jgi:hypothetical protein